MKTRLVYFTILVLAVFQTQSDVNADGSYTDALAARDSSKLLKPTSQEDQLHSVMVREAISLIKASDAGIERAAAQALDELFTKAVHTALSGSPTNGVATLRANTKRVVARLISYGEPSGSGRSITNKSVPVLTITTKSVDMLSRDLKEHISALCPLWPFC